MPIDIYRYIYVRANNYVCPLNPLTVESIELNFFYYIYVQTIVCRPLNDYDENTQSKAYNYGWSVTSEVAKRGLRKYIENERKIHISTTWFF